MSASSSAPIARFWARLSSMISAPASCRRRRSPIRRSSTILRAVCLFDGAARNLVHGLKYRDRTELAPMMARWMARAGAEVIDAYCDVILPVPLHRWRLFSRRFNQAADLARALAVETGKPMLPNALRRRRRTAQQVGLGKAAREANMRKGAFEVTGEGKAELLGKRVLLIDDVYTTGATVSAATRALKRAGVTKVMF